ncbi:hypothetical protein [Mycoplasmopsis agassizii]|uniref:Uncharacterized protein n=1 Tax=Mycoplasmopsis agassizii TaxID=33922 RepID=A0ABX4H6C5_9BACT|nr:hypothetical protein [Mycoplasmopsis agassizii]PAF55333.1 hypothetical protein CJF60_01425 [Mycoplasmopsis agassizii]SMC15784.1 hypothetical protein SAMN02745179_00102 [Mycoplasmopsis agassizii]
MKKKQLIPIIAATSVIAVASGVAAAVLVSQKSNNQKTYLENLYEKVNKIKGTVSLTDDVALAMGILTDQQMVDKVANQLATTLFKKSFTEIHYSEIIEKWKNFSISSLLSLLKVTSKQFKAVLDQYKQLNFEVKMIKKGDKYPMIASITIINGEIKKDVIVNFVDETADKNSPTDLPTSQNSGQQVNSNNLNDQQIINKITKEINAKQLVSKDKTIKASAVYAQYFLNNSETEAEKLKFIKKYVNLPVELNEEMVASLVITQPSEHADNLTVEIVFTIGRQLGVASFSITGFVNVINEFNEYWKTYSETLKTNPLTVKTNLTAKDFFEKIKNLQYANQLYELAKITKNDDHNLKNAFSSLVTPLPVKFGAIINNTFSLVEGENLDKPGHLVLTSKTSFNGIEKTAVILIKGYLSYYQSQDAIFNDPNRELTENEKAQADANNFLSLLKASNFNLKNEAGIIAVINQLNFINSSTSNENTKLELYKSYLATVIVNEEMSKLLTKSTFKKFNFTYNRHATSLTDILTISADLIFGAENNVQVHFEKMPLIGKQKIDDFADENKPIMLDFKNVEIDNFLEVEKKIHYADPENIRNYHAFLYQLNQTEIGAFLYTYEWLGIKITPLIDGEEDKVSVHLKVNDPVKNIDGSFSKKEKDVYFVLKFKNKLKYKNVSLDEFLKAVDIRERFLVMAKRGWLKSKTSGLYMTFMAWAYSGIEKVEAEVLKKDVHDWIWTLEDQNSIKLLGKDAAYNLTQSKNVIKIYLFPSKMPKYYDWTGMGLTIIMFDKQGRQVLYSVPGFGVDIQRV